ncbi:unnamed protein product [Fraxinus pennsylvanica]|uniref:Tetrahydrofolate dehydrogenase/cyclohydrolase catalytic domain-containing protein n=1 Tax=Fraxinus pennsylvanica TaxID=56036 RepID=A0AAD2DVT4_9LAMI|nr:unnamed protein product [Fraxinus pennsylvanica]
MGSPKSNQLEDSRSKEALQAPNVVAIDADGLDYTDIPHSQIRKVLGLAVVIVGNRKDSKSYVNIKRKARAEVGIKSVDTSMPEEVSEAELICRVLDLNANPDVHVDLFEKLQCHRIYLRHRETQQRRDVAAARSANGDVRDLRTANSARSTTGGREQQRHQYQLTETGKRERMLGGRRERRLGMGGENGGWAGEESGDSRPLLFTANPSPTLYLRSQPNK